jgi:polysaccharide biosynthesis/export protein
MKSCFAFVWIVALTVFGGCASSGGVAPAKKSAAEPPAAEYRIGSGDQLNVFVWNHPELSLSVPVRPDGVIATPLVEGIVAAGKTPTQLAADIEEHLKEYVRGPKVNVIVTSFVGALGDQIRVVGQATKPQSLPYRADITLLDVMISVGGLAEFASGNRARLVRIVDGKSVSTPLRLKDLLNGGDMTANIVLRPGDVIIIPESRF